MTKIFKTTIFTGSQVYYFIEHNLGSLYCTVDIRESETKKQIRGTINYMDENTISVCNVPKNIVLEITIVV